MGAAPGGACGTAVAEGAAVLDTAGAAELDTVDAALDVVGAGLGGNDEGAGALVGSGADAEDSADGAGDAALLGTLGAEDAGSGAPFARASARSLSGSTSHASGRQGRRPPAGTSSVKR